MTSLSYWPTTEVLHTVVVVTRALSVYLKCPPFSLWPTPLEHGGYFRQTSRAHVQTI